MQDVLWALDGSISMENNEDYIIDIICKLRMFLVICLHKKQSIYSRPSLPKYISLCRVKFDGENELQGAGKIAVHE